MTPMNNGQNKLVLKDWIWIFVILIGYATALGGSMVNTKVQIQHLEDTKADKTEITDLERSINAKFDETNVRLRAIETQVTRIAERVRIDNMDE